ncbi:MAG: fluoride efflux transporter CrcB [Actinomycetota bacterium]
MNLIIFSFAAAFGAVLRFGFEKWSVRNLGERFPYGTLFVNVIGSFILGYSISRTGWNEQYQLFITSFSGAFTTFGGFIGQTHNRMRHQSERPIAAVYIGLTIGLSLFAAWLGLTA